MNILLRTTYPSSELYKAIDVFTSKELPKRPDYVKEVASFTHSTAAGYEVFFIFEVPDARISEYLKAQSERSAHMQTRVSHLNIEIHVGMSVPDAIGSATPLRGACTGLDRGSTGATSRPARTRSVAPGSAADSLRGRPRPGGSPRRAGAAE